jgi:hypothetical protein
MEPKSRPALPAYLVPLAMLSAGLLQALETMPDGEEGLTEPLPVTVASYLGSVDPNDEGVWTLDAGDALRWKTSPDGRRIIFESGNYPEDDDFVRCLDLRRRSLRDRVALLLVRRLGGEYAAAERAWFDVDRTAQLWRDNSDSNPIRMIVIYVHRQGAQPVTAGRWRPTSNGNPQRLFPTSFVEGGHHQMGWLRPDRPHAEKARQRCRRGGPAPGAQRAAWG